MSACPGAALLAMETSVTWPQCPGDQAGSCSWANGQQQMVKVATEPRLWGLCHEINPAIPLVLPLVSPNNGTQTLGMILEMPPAEFHSSAKLSKSSLLVCFEPIQLHLSDNSQTLSITQLKCLTWVFILWELRSVSGSKVPDLPSPGSRFGLHKAAFPFPRKLSNSTGNPWKLPVDYQLFSDETELHLPMILAGKLFYCPVTRDNCSNPTVWYFCCESFSWLSFSKKIKVGLPEAPICDLTSVPLESVKLPLILGRERSTLKKYPKFCICLPG